MRKFVLFFLLFEPLHAVTWSSIWHLDAGSPVSTTDSTGNGHTLTNTSATSVTGQLNAAAGFLSNPAGSTATQYLDAGATWNTGAAVTAAAWVYLTGTPTAGQVATIVSAGYDGTLTRWQLWINDSRQARFTGFNGSGVVGAQSSGTVPLNTWTHVAGTYSGGTWTIYINAVSNGTASATIPASSGNHTTIGCNSFPGPAFGGAFTGRIDEVYLSDSAGTLADIQANYVAGGGSLPVSASPSSISQGSTGNVVTLTGTGTSWVNGTTTFSISGGSGASVTAQSVASSTSASITVTAGSVTGTLTVSNNTDSNTATLTVTAAVTTISVTDSHIVWSPYASQSDGSGSIASNNIRSDATKVVWNNMGGYFKTDFTCTSLTLNVTENSVAGGKYRVAIDDGGWSQGALSGSDTSIVLASGLSNATHTVEFVLSAMNTTPDRWTGSPQPTQSLMVNSFAVDFGCTLATPSNEVAKRAKNILFYGDSITEGYGSDGSGPLHDSQHSWAYYVARGLGAEYGIVGFSGQGWVTAVSAANLPVFPSTWDLYQSGVARVFAPTPDYVVILHGKNDGTSSLTNVIRPVLTAMRSSFGATVPIFLMVPFDQTERANIISEFNAQSDARVYLLDLGNQQVVGAKCSSDGTHPLAECNAGLAAVVTQAIQAKLSSGGSFPIGQ